MSIVLFIVILALVVFALAAFDVKCNVNLIAVGLFLTTLATALSMGNFFK